MRRAPVAPVLVLALVLVLGLGAGAVGCSSGSKGRASSPSSTDRAAATTSAAGPRGQFARDLQAYAGLGAWVDVFDYVPAYQRAGQQPVVSVADIDAMAAHGVDTLYLQVARIDDRTPSGLVDPALFLPLLRRAHELKMRVVGWYYPTFVDVQADLDRLLMIHRYADGDQRFDGLAVDIEPDAAVADPAVRSARLVELSRRLRDAVGRDPVGAIINPPVLTEVVNPRSWPDFPYRELKSLYDVWLPMAYWTGRTQSSGYRDGYTYAEESVRRLRANLDDPAAKVHLIGGVAEDAITEDQVRAFLRAVTDTDAVGASLYDYRSMRAGLWGILRDGLATALDAAPQGPTSTITPIVTAPPVITPAPVPTVAPTTVAPSTVAPTIR